jgi:DNA-directed RNA polymerase subunit RPC12/RpoP
MSKELNKNLVNYDCMKCNFVTLNKGDYQRHTESIRHKYFETLPLVRENFEQFKKDRIIEIKKTRRIDCTICSKNIYKYHLKKHMRENHQESK